MADMADDGELVRRQDRFTGLCCYCCQWCDRGHVVACPNLCNIGNLPARCFMGMPVKVVIDPFSHWVEWPHG